MFWPSFGTVVNRSRDLCGHLSLRQVQRECLQTCPAAEGWTRPLNLHCLGDGS